MTRTDKIRMIRAGGEQDQRIEYPIFYEFKDGFYVAGDYRLTKEEFERINRKQPCFLPPIWIKKGETYKAGNMTLSQSEYDNLSDLMKQTPVITFKS